MSKFDTLQRTIGWIRIALGTALVVAPGRAAQTWLGAEGNIPGVRLLFRSVGARDVALGAGLLFAAEDDAAWARAGVLADTCDVAASVAALGGVPGRRLLPGTILAIAFVAAGLTAQRRPTR